MNGTSHATYTMTSPFGRDMPKERDFRVSGIRFKFMGWDFEYGPASCWESVGLPTVVYWRQLKSTFTGPYSWICWCYDRNRRSINTHDHSSAVDTARRIIRELTAKEGV